MRFSQINIVNLRCIENATLAPGKRINLIVGNNASGKTSLLEAIYMLGRGNTFRQKRMGAIISHGKNYLTVTGRAVSDNNRYRIGVAKTQGKTKVTVDGQKIDKLTVLAKTVPLQLVTPNIQNFFQGESLYRRRLIDWGLFHVEPSFEQISKRYQRVLSQRNKAIKSGDNSFVAWDPELIRLGRTINGLRTDYFQELIEALNNLGLDITSRSKLTFDWKQGWNGQESLERVIEKNKISDQTRGFTQAGPHRADFDVKMFDQSIKSRGSRGEQKMIAVGILLAQYGIISKRLNNPPVLLLDDLESELDRSRRFELFEKIEKLDNAQVYLTSLNMTIEKAIRPSKMFHVEHGVITELSV